MSVLKVFILEDSESRIKEFKKSLVLLTPYCEITVAKDMDHAVDLYKASRPHGLVFLDHDLGDQAYVSSEERNTGSEFVRQTHQMIKEDNSTVVIHSLNPDGAEYMKNYLSDNDIESTLIPFAWTVGNIRRLNIIK